MLILKVFYSMQDTRTPMIVAAIIIGFNIGVDFLFFYSFSGNVMKVSGLALGNSTAYLVGAVAVWILLRKRFGGLDGRKIARSLFRICLASAVMGGACYGTARLISSLVNVNSFPGELLQVTSAILVAAGVYLAAVTLMGSEEMGALKRLLSRFMKRGQSDMTPHGREPVEEDSIIK